MKIYVCRKSLSDIKNLVVKIEYNTDASTVVEFINEMVAKNYARKPVKDSLQECQTLACFEFENSGFYIVNITKNIRYSALSDNLNLSENDEIVLIKLKYLRGIIW